MLLKYWYHHFYKLVTILSPKYSVTNYFVIELTFSVKNQRHRKFSVIVFINESPIFPRNFWCQTNLSPNETIRPLMAAWKWRRPYRPCSPCHGPPHHPTPLQPSRNLLARAPLVMPRTTATTVHHCNCHNHRALFTPTAHHMPTIVYFLFLKFFHQLITGNLVTNTNHRCLPPSFGESLSPFCHQILVTISHRILSPKNFGSNLWPN